MSVQRYQYVCTAFFADNECSIQLLLDNFMDVKIRSSTSNNCKQIDW